MTVGRGGGAGTGPGRMGGDKAAGPGGKCVCPSCGHTETHARAVPCYKKRCTECGGVMTRG